MFKLVLDEVQTLMDLAFGEVDGKPSPRSALNQLGLIDGSGIVLDYLDHNEGGVAFDHLIYMIFEPPLQITPSCFDRLAALGTSLGLDPSS